MNIVNNNLLLIAAASGIYLGLCVWRLMKRFPMWLRLQIALIMATLLAALMCVGIGYFEDGGEVLSWHGVEENERGFFGLWFYMYFASMVIVCICYVIKRVFLESKSKHVANTMLEPK